MNADGRAEKRAAGKGTDSESERNAMNARKMFWERMLGAAGGMFVAVLFALPLALMVYALFAIDYSYNPRELFIPVIGIVLFGSGVFIGIRNAVRRWREISQLQTILGAMSEEERKEFDAAIAQSDVELCTDESGKSHVLPMDH